MEHVFSMATHDFPTNDEPSSIRGRTFCGTAAERYNVPATCDGMAPKFGVCEGDHL